MSQLVHGEGAGHGRNGGQDELSHPPGVLRRLLSSMSLAVQGFLILALVILCTWATSFVLLKRGVQQHERARLEQEMEGARLTTLRRLRAADEELARDATSLAGLVDLQGAVTRRHSEDVLTALEATGELSHWELVLVTDYLGRPLGGSAAGLSEADLLASKALGAAVAGEEERAYWSVVGSVFQTRLAPVLGTDEVLGSVVVGRRLDGAFLEALKGHHDCELTLEADGVVLAATAAPTSGARRGDAPTALMVPVGHHEGGGDVVLKIHPPIHALVEAGLPWGALTGSAAVWAGVALVLGALAARSHRRSRTRLEQVVSRIGDGKMDGELPVGGCRDDAVLGRALLRMRARLKRQRLEDDAARRKLEGVVESKRRELVDVEERLGRAQASLVECEGFARLGRMAAELTHEVSTPAATLNSVLSGIRHGLLELIGYVRQLKSFPLAADEQELLVAVLEDLARRTSQGQARPLADPDEVARIVRELEDAGVDHPEPVARTLVRSGLAIWSSRLQGLLRRDDSGYVIGALESFARVQLQLQSGLMAVGVITGLIRSMRSNSRPEAEPPQANIREGLEDALTLLEHEMLDLIEVTRDLPSLPPVHGDGGELCQVWTNLIHNAVQAMCPDGGRLSLEARPEGHWVTVRVTDTGPGIEPELQKRIFEPYFSTKTNDDGSGVGLAIARKIVEGFGGNISVISVPGRTQFEVRLPTATLSALERS